MASKRGWGLMRYARFTRAQLIGYALISAALNGIVTASVGAWLGQTYAQYQTRRQSIESLVHLVYERRTRGGMLASSLRRDADIDEVRFRKRAYDEAYVEWNKTIMQNIFSIREVTGVVTLSKLESHLEDGLIAAFADVDRCLTKAYDARLKNEDPKPILVACEMPMLHQFTLDCGATFTNELYKLSRLSFMPASSVPGEGPDVSERRIAEACLRPDPKPAPPAVPAPAVPAPAAAPAAASPTPPSPTPPSTSSPSATP
ncbi:MAG: hypothetical protein NW216_02010 [Hyphomicrobium sp.]|nr:hypothetical protein [Hyphomicrobium sp.]